jgi:hypothetical protein
MTTSDALNVTATSRRVFKVALIRGLYIFFDYITTSSKVCEDSFSLFCESSHA